jgi:hypothetical protein
MGGSMAGIGGASGIGAGGAMAVGGASGVAGSTAGGGASGTGGSPDLGPPGADGFAVKVQLASDIKATAPTTVGIVQWSLGQPGLTAAHIDFGLDTTYGMAAPVDLTRAGYRTVLVGMKPARSYHFRIVATDGSHTYTSDDRTLTTGAPLATSLLAGFDLKTPGRVDKGFFITSYWNLAAANDTTWMAFILDTDGDVVWWYTDPADNARGELGLARACLSADSQDIWIARATNSGAPLRRISIDGLEEQKYAGTVASHDIAAVSGGTMAYLDYGEKDCTSVFEIDKTGATKEAFESTGVTATDNHCHGNSVRYSMKEDVYSFSDDYNDVVVVGRDGSVKWKLGDRVAGGHASWGGYQHGTQLLDSSILIFANDGRRRPEPLTGDRARPRRQRNQEVHQPRGHRVHRRRAALAERQHAHRLRRYGPDPGSGRDRRGGAGDPGHEHVRLRRIPPEPVRATARHPAVTIRRRRI